MKKRWLVAMTVALGIVAQGAMAQRNEEFPRDIHGLWWQPTDPGWATAVFDQQAAMSSALLVYDQNGKPTWFLARRLDCSNSVSAYLQVDCSGALFRVIAPWFGDSTFQPELARFEPVGEWSGTFLSPLFGGTGPDVRRILFASYMIEGRTVIQAGDMPLVVQIIDPDANFLYLDTAQSGLWGTPGETGWYVGLFQQGNRLVATLLVHGRDRRPHWFVVNARGPEFGGNPERVYVGEVFETRGHPFGARDALGYQARLVGHATVKFGATAAEGATLRYSVDGVEVSKNIIRLP